ncbi:MAG TPA: hypothetical protein DHV48_13955 [Prolixibacteraceae bacterium]|nr:hypothetical protein [Prolixibacteraceae bacterium]
MTDQGKKYLSDILRAIELIDQFTSSVSNYSEYVSDLKTQSAVERQLGIIGEAVNKFDKLFPDITLENARKIVGFRNRLIHTYDAVDSSMIWAIIKKYLEPLKTEVLKKQN